MKSFRLSPIRIRCHGSVLANANAIASRLLAIDLHCGKSAIPKKIIRAIARYLSRNPRFLIALFQKFGQSGTELMHIRDHALLAVLAYTGCRVGELSRLRIRDYKTTGAHRILEVQGKGGKERRVPLPVEAVECLEAWLVVLAAPEGPLFRPALTARGRGHDGFRPQPMSRRAMEYLMERYVRMLGLDLSVTVHSMRVTAITTARERGCDLIDLQDWAGHADPRTTLTYIRNRDRLSRSPAYTLKY